MSTLERLKLSIVLPKAKAIKDARFVLRPGPVIIIAVSGGLLLTIQPPDIVMFVLSPLERLVMPSALSVTKPSGLSTPVAGAKAVA